MPLEIHPRLQFKSGSFVFVSAVVVGYGHVERDQDQDWWKSSQVILLHKFIHEPLTCRRLRRIAATLHIPGRNSPTVRYSAGRVLKFESYRIEESRFAAGGNSRR